MKKLLLIIFATLLIPFLGTAQNSGALDVTFDTDGIAITPISSSVNDYGTAVAIQPDEKILVAGYMGSGSSADFFIVRYNTDGSLDNTFGTNGITITQVGTNEDRVYGIALQTDGKIVVSGASYSTATNFDFALVRYNDDGTLDNTFSSDGKVVTNFGGTDYGYNVTLQDDGKIVLAGYTNSGGNNDFAVARYNTDGSLDNSFSSDGKVVTPVGSGNDLAYSVAVQLDGKIVVGGRAAMGTDNDFAVVRYNTDGSLDTGFDLDGKVTTDFGGYDDNGKSLIVQPNQSIIVVGSVYNGTDTDFGLARYNPDGSLDNSFNYDGKVTTDINSGSNDEPCFSATIQTDGRIVVAGSSGPANDRDFALVRYHLTGFIDNSFDGDGTVTTDISGNDDVINFLALYPNGKIIATGSSHNGLNYDMTTARYFSKEGDPVGINDNSEPAFAFTIYPNPASSSIIINGEWAINNGQLKIMNTQGQLVYQCAMGNEQLTIDVSALSKGIYFLSLKDGEQTVNRKFVKE